jgi:hypothetical protein
MVAAQGLNRRSRLSNLWHVVGFALQKHSIRMAVTGFRQSRPAVKRLNYAQKIEAS